MRPMTLTGLAAACLLALAGCDDGGTDGGALATLDAQVAVDGGAADRGAVDGGGAADLGAEVDAALPDAALPDALAPDAMAPVAQLMVVEGHERDIGGNWLCAGQPSEGRVRALVDQGAVIISLRTPGEDPFDEPGLVAELGGTFIRYPTTGADYDTVAFREAMYDLYDGWRAQDVPVYLHCASGNRAGASWALYNAERLGLPADEAIALGRAAGLTGLEGRVRAILGVD